MASAGGQSGGGDNPCYPISSYISSSIQHCFPGGHFESRQNNRQITLIKKTGKIPKGLGKYRVEGENIREIQVQAVL